jgi:hypothetical protein
VSVAGHTTSRAGGRHTRISKHLFLVCVCVAEQVNASETTNPELMTAVACGRTSRSCVRQIYLFVFLPFVATNLANFLIDVLSLFQYDFLERNEQ